jgi:hypothetical protein
LQEEQKGNQEKEVEPSAGSSQVRPEEDKPVQEVQEYPTDGEQEPVGATHASPVQSEPVEEAEEEEPVREELIQRRGCLRGCLTPIAAIFVVVMIIVMAVYAKRGAISGWLRQRIVANTQNHVLSDLPEGMDEREIEATFEKVKAALKEGMIDVEILDEAIAEYQDAVRKRPPPDEKKLEISRLTEGLNAAMIVPEE